MSYGWLMDVNRRAIMAGGIGMAVLGASGPATAAAPGEMYGLIGKMTSVPGARDRLVELLLAATSDMPGCLSYVIAKDPADANGIWITEAWDSKESHAASLKLPAVRAVIAEARPLIAGFSDRHETVPVGGAGLRRA